MNEVSSSPSTAPAPAALWRRPGLLVLYVAFLAALLAITLAAAEFVVLPWRYRPVPRAIQLCGFHAPPNTLVDDTEINALGFTGDNISPAKFSGTVRFLTLGGSAMFNRRMTERLGVRLREAASQPVELLGAALRGHTTVASVLKYEALADYEFDCVIIYHGINDLFANNVPASTYRPDYSQIDPWYHRGPIVDRSLLVRRISNRSADESRVATAYPQPDVENGAQFASAQVFEASLRRIIETAQGRREVPVLVTFAWAIPPNYSRDAFDEVTLGYNNREYYDPCPVETWGSPAYVAEGIQRHNAITRRLAAEYGVPLLDQEALMGKDLQWYGDVCHFSEPGTERFIGFLVEFVLKEKLLRP